MIADAFRFIDWSEGYQPREQGVPSKGDSTWGDLAQHGWIVIPRENAANELQPTRKRPLEAHVG
jgi:hypothetical protein